MLSKSVPACPPWLLEKAQALPRLRTAVVNAGDQTTLASVRLAVAESLIEPVLVGNSRSIEDAAERIGWSIEGLTIEDTANEQEAVEKSMTLARDGAVQSMMKGMVHTDTLLRAAIHPTKGIRTRRRLSHVFLMTVKDNARYVCVTDAVIRVKPSVSVKLDIARNAVDLLHALGCQRPKVAVLSGTEVPVKSVPSSIEAAEVARIAKEKIADAIVEGPLSFDIAVSPSAAEIKGVTGRIVGDADVLLVPNIEAGNFMFKQMVYFSGATAAGIVLGAKVPIILTSRADPPVARLASSGLATIVAAAMAG